MSIRLEAGRTSQQKGQFEGSQKPEHKWVDATGLELLVVSDGKRPWRWTEVRRCGILKPRVDLDFMQRQVRITAGVVIQAIMTVIKIFFCCSMEDELEGKKTSVCNSWKTKAEIWVLSKTVGRTGMHLRGG